MVRPEFYKTSWLGGYSFCAANDARMLSFETQDEHDKFIDYVTKNAALIRSLAGLRWNMYIDIYSNVVKNVTGFMWYTTGEPVLPRMKLHWNPGEPNGALTHECCLTILQYDNPVGLNDFPCNYIDHSHFGNTVVCQKTTWNVLPKGMKKY